MANPKKRPAVAGDIVVFAKRIYSGQYKTMVKAYHGCYCGGHWASTKYADRSKDALMFMDKKHFVGVVTAIATSDGKLKMYKDIRNYPEDWNDMTTLDKEPGNVSFVPLTVNGQCMGITKDQLVAASASHTAQYGCAYRLD